MTWHTYIHRKNNWELTSSQNRLRLMDTSSSQVRINDFNDKWTWKPKWWSCHNRMNMLTRLIFVYWGCLGTCSLTPNDQVHTVVIAAARREGWRTIVVCPLDLVNMRIVTQCDVMWALGLVKYVYPCKFQWFFRE